MNSHPSLTILFCLFMGKWIVIHEILKTPLLYNLEKRHVEEVLMAMNKAMFEEKWKEIRVQSTARWGLMADFDLNKVDKAEVKFDKFVTMLQVKYGYTRQQAREEVGKFWAEYEAKNKGSR